MSKEYKQSPILTFGHTWVNTPDTKYDEKGLGGVFKVDAGGAGEEVEAFKADIKDQSEAAAELYLEEQVRQGKMKPKDKEKWTVYYPYTEEEDDEGNPTGETTFHFKQNAVIRLKDGTTKAVKIGIKDGKNKDVPASVKVFSGTVGRVLYSTRVIPMQSLKQVGIRLDFAAIQIKTLGTGSKGGFGTMDDGYSADLDAADQQRQASTGAGAAEGDY